MWTTSLTAGVCTTCTLLPPIHRPPRLLTLSLRSNSLWSVCRHAEHVHSHNHKGELVRKQDLSQALYGMHAYNGHRVEMHQILVDYVPELVVEIRMGEEITEFF